MLVFIFSKYFLFFFSKLFSIIKEKKYKEFKINLELLHDQFESVKSTIPQHLASLYEPHLKQALDVVNPGCYILTWSSLNIGMCFLLLLLFRLKQHTFQFRCIFKTI